MNQSSTALINRSYFVKFRFAFLVSLLLLISGCDSDGNFSVTGQFFPPNPEPLGENWRMLFYHVHTIHSEDNKDFQIFKPTVAQALVRAGAIAAASGTDAAVTITDHRTIDGYHDPEFAPIGNAVPIKGEEWGGKGHAGPLGFSGDTPITDGDGPDDYEAMITETHAEGGIVVVNHPINWHADRALDVDALEVLHGPFWEEGGENSNTLAWWQRLLVAGEQITAMGGSDSHFQFHPFETPLNLVSAPTNSQEDMLDAVKKGRVMVVKSPTSPRVILTADLDNDGFYDDAMIGDKISVSTPRTISFEARLEGAGSLQRLKLVDRNGTFYNKMIGSGKGEGWDGSTYRFTRTFSPNEKNFVRAEIFKLEPLGLVCLTNPIYAVGTNTSANTEAALQGMVTLAGNVVEDYAIEISPNHKSSTTPNADGSYHVILPHGIYTVTVTVPGVSPLVTENIVIDDGDVTLDFAL